jgi:hypothetical protein
MGLIVVVLYAFHYCTSFHNHTLHASTKDFSTKRRLDTPAGDPNVTFFQHELRKIGSCFIPSSSGPMTKLWCTLQYSLHCWSRKHSLTPFFYVRPILDIHAQELKHPRHGEWEVREVSQGRPILEGDKIMTRLRQALLHDIPVPKDICM